MITITKASDPIEVKQITVTIYAPPGVGKTSMGFTASDPLLFDFDKGAYRSQFRKDSVQVNEWNDVDGMTIQDLAAYKTVIVDTAGRALDSLAAALIAKNPKFKGFGGQLTLQGFGALKAAFIGWLKLLHSAGKDVVLIAHMDEQKDGDTIIERLDITGGSKAEIYKVADAMGRIKIQGNQRTLNFNPSDTAYGKNPAQLPILQVPDYGKEPQFLAEVIQGIKDKLNESSEAALAETARIRELRESFEHFEDADAFTKQVAKMAKAQPKDKTLLVEVAAAKGFIFDKSAKTFKASGATA
jgi:hypothetical protein